MRDIALQLNNGFFDIVIDGQDLMYDDGLENALSLSIFSDARVTEDQLPYGSTNKRGWWGDLFSEIPGDKIGSRLWTINPAKITEDTRNLTEDYCRESTKWLIDDGIADTINFTTEYNVNKHLNILIETVRPGGVVSKFQVVWDAQKVRRL
jgi:phage gp46-like protein